mmetsp:Transcript_29733/g.45556  ORF Transcript_29733/g.45556 Transcript_29733/m.45556 type:complete len:97 (+) Transcript_29733:572-862(+)
MLMRRRRNCKITIRVKHNYLARIFLSIVGLFVCLFVLRFPTWPLFQVVIWLALFRGTFVRKKKGKQGNKEQKKEEENKIISFMKISKRYDLELKIR